MSEIDIPRPTSGDVLERILEDHRLFEDLLRLARRNDTDREAARHALAEVLVAHATAEEEKVYPTLRTKRAITAHEEEHGEEEHAEIIEALAQYADQAVSQLRADIPLHLGREGHADARERLGLRRRQLGSSAECRPRAHRAI